MLIHIVRFILEQISATIPCYLQCVCDNHRVKNDISWPVDAGRSVVEWHVRLYCFLLMCLGDNVLLRIEIAQKMI